MCPNLFFVKGSQPQEEYSRCGRHKLVDNQKRVLLIMPICFLALLMSSAIWFENFRSNCSITPKYLQWLMCSTKCTLGLFLKGGRHYIIQSAETVSEAGRQWSYTSSSPMFFSICIQWLQVGLKSLFMGCVVYHLVHQGIFGKEGNRAVYMDDY